MQNDSTIKPKVRSKRSGNEPINGIIYLAVHIESGKKYVGQTAGSLDKRIRAHMYGNCYFSNALRRYGREAFTISVIDTATTRSELDVKEKAWIKEHDCIAPSGYNLTSGGEGGIPLTPEGSRIISDRGKLKVGPLNPNYGKQWPEERKLALSAKTKGVRVGINHPNFGKHHTEETVANMKASNWSRGSKRSEVLAMMHTTESCQKKSESAKARADRGDLPFLGKKHSEETLERMRLAWAVRKTAMALLVAS
jgi:group I intron endonuclease